jgi:predicted metal-dependent peptidase
MIQVTKDGRIQYIWGREFFDGVSDNALIYIALHEALHVILDHIGRRQDRDPLVWNISADIAVNEVLDDILPKSKIMTIYDIENDPILFARHTSMSNGLYSYNQSTESIYKELMRGKKSQQEAAKQVLEQLQKDGQSKEGDDADGKGEGKADSKDGKGTNPANLDNHDGWDGHLDSETQQSVSDLLESLKEEEKKLTKYRRGRKAGMVSSHLVIELNESKRNFIVPWQKLLRNRLASVYRPNETENWARVHRKMYEFYPEVVLPGPHESDTPTSLIFVTIDTSGSMDEDVIAELVGIVETLPKDQYEVIITWFDTELYEATDLKMPMGRGGTSFKAIESVLTQNKPLYTDEFDSYYGSNKGNKSKKEIRYPDIVVVLTDGEACTPSLEHPDRWIFIITANGTEDYVKDLGSTIWRL